ncbi:uncharacterized protein LOC119159943 [Rhipicephalus microplus]|uniref:uncharacterized protein LOC119159943 n=1 Tax=Rhipicephalus microplus TaxID=6941 RepID=UPI003F6C1CB6
MKIICLFVVLCMATTILARPPYGGPGRRRGPPGGFGRGPPQWFPEMFLRRLCQELQFPTTVVPGVRTAGPIVPVSFGSDSTVVSLPSGSTITPLSTEATPQGVTIPLGA